VIKKNVANYMIMGMLNMEPLTGYELKKKFEDSIINSWNLSFGQIYPTLKVLEKKGFVTQSTRTNPNRPPSKVYNLTEKGRQELTKWLSGNISRERLKYEIFLKLFFGGQISIAENINNIREFRAKNLEELKALKDFESECVEIFRGEFNEKKRCYLVAMLMRYVYRACIDWADKAIDILSRIKE